jgi:DNA-binding IclR family transcriptional regulator
VHDMPCLVKRLDAIGTSHMKKRSDESIHSTLEQAQDDPRFVTALSRGLMLLRCFRKGDAGLGNQELAERSGLPKSTVSRLTYTLAALNYLSYSSSTGQYHLSATVLGLGFSALGGLAIRDVARPLLRDVAMRTGVSTAMAVPDERTMVYIESCRGSGPLQLGIDVGSHIKMATSSLGRAYLASLDAASREAKLAVLCAADHENAGAIRSGVAHAVQQLQKHGYVTSVGEWREEVNSVGVPVVLPGGHYFAINCGGSAIILRESMLPDVAEQLKGVAASLKATLGLS